MPKFYIESGEIMEIVHRPDFMSAVVDVVREYADRIKNGEIRVGDYIAVNELGFVTELANKKGREHLDLEHVRKRRNDSRIIEHLDSGIILLKGEILFLPLDELLDST